VSNLSLCSTMVETLAQEAGVDGAPYL
jgi:hypothetical protein